MRSLIFCFILTLPLVLTAQEDYQIQLNLAEEFFLNKEYDKSIDLYEEIFKKNPSKEIYLPLINAYLAAGQAENAEKLVKKQLRKSPTDPVYQVDYGYVLSILGENKKSEEAYKDAIKDLPPNTNAVLALSNSFQRRNEIPYAIECLKRGKKITGEYYGYEFELGELYYQSGDLNSMINEYLDLLEKNEGYLQNVQNALNTSIYQDPKKEQLQILNQALLKRIQKNPGNNIIAEMLIWHYLQQKDFKNAIVQTKALDKRNGENGYRFLNLGKNCLSNREYDLSIECYQYLVDKGPSSQHYISARILMTEAIREKITASPYTREDILTMEDNYLQTLKDIGKNAATISLQIGLAEVWAFYLDKTEEAIELLSHALKSYNMNPTDASKCKLLLADIYLSVNEIWEASLLYSQVEKDFKYDALGDLAKFKNARISFFTGDFAWSKAQLDVLKGSTSKLISNDAMRLSLLITDNLAFDTSGEALKMYAKASLAFEQNRLDETLLTLDTMEVIYLLNTIIDEVYYLKYKLFFKEQKYLECVDYLKKIADNYADEILADEAVFNLAVLYDSYLNDSKKAQEYYQQLFTKYPGSIYVPEARLRFRKIRGDEIN